MADHDRTSTDSVQGLCAFVAFSLGLIPLVKVALGGEVGRLLSWVPGTESTPGSWLIPALVILGCVALIGVLERQKD